MKKNVPEKKNSQDRNGIRVTRRSFLTTIGLAASAAVAGCEAPSTDTRNISLVPPTPAPTPIPLVDQYPEVPYTPTMPPPEGVFRVFMPHEARTVEALTARIMPGTPDDPGAREAGVVYYIDNMLNFHEGFNEATYREPPYAQIYSDDKPPVEAGATVASSGTVQGPVPPTPTPLPTTQPTPTPTPTPTLTPPPPAGSAITSPQAITGTAILTATELVTVTAPASTQPGPSAQSISYQSIWVPASEIDRYGYQSILTPREVYRIGVAALDRYTNSKHGHDFVDLSEADQDGIIDDMVKGKITDFDKNLNAISFFHILRVNTSEGMFSDPVYGGNRNLVGWKLVGYPGAQRAYQPHEFQSEGTDRQPQSIMQMHQFNAGEPANGDVIMPVSGSEKGEQEGN